TFSTWLLFLCLFLSFAAFSPSNVHASPADSGQELDAGTVVVLQKVSKMCGICYGNLVDLHTMGKVLITPLKHGDVEVKVMDSGNEILVVIADSF
ncbi:MAG: hypothetical protein AAF570_19830, partial [Bacteroidota bacterium]